MPPTPDTQRKLQETAFFLRHMELEEQKAVRNEPEAFGFYLSAFLSAGRSVTFVLQTETSTSKEDWEPWFSAWLSSRTGDEQTLLKLMNDQRRFEVHNTGAVTTVDWEMVSVVDIHVEHPRHPAYGFTWTGPPGVPPPTVGLARHSFDGHAEQAVPACKRYLQLLHELVDAFQKTN